MSYETIFRIAVISILCFFINIPFGMLRYRTKKFSILWFFCIHAPIPVSAVLRRVAGFTWHYIFFFLVFSIAGQMVGNMIMEKRHGKSKA